MKLGAHLPTSKGFVAALEDAQKLDCDCLQIFSKSPRQWKAPPLDETRVSDFRAAWDKSNFAPLVVHDSYLINLAAPDETILEKSLRAMIDEVRRADALGADFLVTHCGAHLGAKEKGRKGEGEKGRNEGQANLFDASTSQPSNLPISPSEAAGVQRLAQSLKHVLEATPNAKVKIALENTAGQGTCLGGPFEHLGEVLREVGSDRLAVCFDTCHAFAAGHDLVNNLENVLRNLDETVGLQRLGVIHLNDSKGALGGHLDRHDHIGDGLIGRAAMKSIVNHPQLKNKPFILETPETETMIATNLNTVRALRNSRGRKNEK